MILCKLLLSLQIVFVVEQSTEQLYTDIWNEAIGDCSFASQHDKAVGVSTGCPFYGVPEQGILVAYKACFRRHN